MSDPQKDEHIEELLSKLQGIFGKLSHSEEEEEKPKIHLPLPPAPKPTEPANDHAMSSPAAAPTLFPAPTLPVPAPEPAVMPSSAPVMDGPVETAALSGYESMVPLQDPEKIIVPTAVFYPSERTAEAKILAQKLETMTPKFTRVAFRLRVVVFMPYDPKMEWKGLILEKAAKSHFQTVFVLMDRPLDDGKRKSLAAEIEEHGVYFQEVLTTSIEKKAFYTDVLLGLVFFFDSHKPNTPAPE
jgi:hypothetical protein